MSKNHERPDLNAIVTPPPSDAETRRLLIERERVYGIGTRLLPGVLDHVCEALDSLPGFDEAWGSRDSEAYTDEGYQYRVVVYAESRDLRIVIAFPVAVSFETGAAIAGVARIGLQHRESELDVEERLVLAGTPEEPRLDTAVLDDTLCRLATRLVAKLAEPQPPTEEPTLSYLADRVKRIEKTLVDNGRAMLALSKQLRLLADEAELRES